MSPIFKIGDHVTVADLVYDRDRVRVLADENQIVAGVLAPRMVEEAPKAEGVEVCTDQRTRGHQEGQGRRRIVCYVCPFPLSCGQPIIRSANDSDNG